MKRRDFLIVTTGFIVNTILHQKLSATKLPDVVIQVDKRSGLNDAQWKTLDVALDHLFPSESDKPEAPGARDFHATAWIHNALIMPDVKQEQRDMMRDGVIKLEETSQSLHKKAFTQLNETQREQTLRALEKNREGNIWLRETLRYILEALLSDPVYGGNPDGMGWKWLKHQAGFPLPTADKRYFML